MDRILPEEFIAQFKTEPRLREIYMVWVDDRYSLALVELYGTYRYLGSVRFTRGGINAYHEDNFIYSEFWNNVTAKRYTDLIDSLIKLKLRKDRPIPKVKNSFRDSYKKYFPNLAAETSWKLLPIPAEHLIAGNIDHPSMRGAVHLEMLATERKLAAALGASPLPIPIRLAIIEG
jgi:hypothetical protein